MKPNQNEACQEYTVYNGQIITFLMCSFCQTCHLTLILHLFVIANIRCLINKLRLLPCKISCFFCPKITAHISMYISLSLYLSIYIYIYIYTLYYINVNLNRYAHTYIHTNSYRHAVINMHMHYCTVLRSRRAYYVKSTTCFYFCSDKIVNSHEKHYLSVFLST